MSLEKGDVDCIREDEGLGLCQECNGEGECSLRTEGLPVLKPQRGRELLVLLLTRSPFYFCL